MSKVTLTNLANLQNESTAVSAINANNVTLTTAIDNTLSRDGTTPNQMMNLLDMNSQQIINLPAPGSANSPLRLADAPSGIGIPISSVPPVGTSGAVVGFLNGNNTHSGSNTFSGTNTFSGPIVATNSFTQGKSVTVAPSALGTSQRPVNLFSVNSENINSSNIEGLMSIYIFGGASSQGLRFAGYDYIANTAATGNTFGQYCATYGGAYTNVGDGGGVGSEKGNWFGANFTSTLDTGASNSISCVGVEADTIAKSTVFFNVGVNAVGGNTVRGSFLDTAYAVGGGDFSGNATAPHIGWKNCFTITDFNGVSPVYASTKIFSHYWTGGGTKAIATGIDLSGFTFSGNAFNSPSFSVSGAGAIASTSISTGPITSNNFIKSISPISGIGYGTGAGGAITQLTSKATGVTLNTISGVITTFAADAMTASSQKQFTLTNSNIAVTDTVSASTQGAGASGQSYYATVSDVVAGSCTINLIRTTVAGSLSEAVKINFNIIKGVSS